MSQHRPSSSAEPLGIHHLHPENDKVVAFLPKRSSDSVGPDTTWIEMHSACAAGNILLARHLQRRHRFKFKHVGGFTILTVCSNGHALVLKWLIEEVGPIPRKILINGAHSALFADKPEVLDVIRGEIRMGSDEILDTQVLDEIGARELIGSLEWIKRNYGEDDQKIGAIVVTAAVKAKAMLTIRWMYTFYHACRSSRNSFEMAFRLACQFDSRRIAAWLTQRYTFAYETLLEGTVIARQNKSQNILLWMKDADYVLEDSTTSFAGLQMLRVRPPASPPKPPVLFPPRVISAGWETASGPAVVIPV